MRNGFSDNLIARIFPNEKLLTLDELESRFPVRNLPDGAMVTRFAPSPTGFMHIGGLYSMLIDFLLARQSGGVFILRIEDTDTERTVDNAIQLIMGTQFVFKLFANEGPKFDVHTESWSDNGNYGPYMQSARKQIYHSVAAELLRRGDAYPCFLGADKMEQIRTEQKSLGMATGIYGEWAEWRNCTESDVERELDAGHIPTIRLYSRGDKTQKIYCRDGVRGSIAFPQNDEDIVLIKSGDGLPTYHFAHLCDDHFMRTTNVVRGEEWLPSFPLHIQMFNMMGWTPPVYIHTSTIDKIDADTGKQRKISKRKDPESNVDFFVRDGFPAEAVMDYLLNIISSGYEEARAKNPTLHWYEYPINLKKIPSSGALFDMKKLEWWAREDIARMSAEDIYNSVTSGWDNGIVKTTSQTTQTGDATLWAKLAPYKDYLIQIFGIERTPPVAHSGDTPPASGVGQSGGMGQTSGVGYPPCRNNSDTPPASGVGQSGGVGQKKRVRKDFVTWRQTLDDIEYFFEDKFIAPDLSDTDTGIIKVFLNTFDISDDRDTWWNKIVAVAQKFGIKNGDVAMALRVCLTGRQQTPDLYSIMQVMGDARIRERLGK